MLIPLANPWSYSNSYSTILLFANTCFLAVVISELFMRSLFRPISCPSKILKWHVHCTQHPSLPKGTGMIFFPETVLLCVLLPQRLILCLRGGCLLQVILWPKSPGWSNSFRGRKLIGCCCWWKKRLVDFFV